MPFGVTSNGFERKDLQTILEEIEESQRDDIDPGLNQEADSLLGQLNGVMVNALSELWEVAEAVYNAFNPDTASNQSLDNVAAITGSTRRPATPSTVLADVTLDPGTTLPAGSVATVAGDPDARFLLDTEIVWPGPGPFTFVDQPFTAESTGPTVANAGTLTGGPELVTGWASVTNPLDATLGTDDETDAAFRARRLAEVAGAGGSTLEAIRSDVSRVAGVTAVSAIENTSGVVDPVTGLPAKSFEVIVSGGLDADIASAIFGSKPAGILSFGTTTELVENSEGDDVPISFTRPTEVEIWLEIDVLVDGTYPVGGDAAVAEAVATFGDARFGQGDDVVLAAFNASIFSVLGVRDISEIRAGFAVSPTGTVNLPILLRQLARFDTARIAVSSSAFVDV